MTPEELLRAAGVEFRVHEHEPVRTVADVVALLPFPAEQHVKALALDAGGRIALVGLRGCDRVAHGPLARALGVARDRVRPLARERVVAELGMEPGGVCLLSAADVVVVADVRVAQLAPAYFGSGRTNATIEAQGADLVRAARAALAEIAIST